MKNIYGIVRFAAAALAAAAALSFASCSGGGNGKETDGETNIKIDVGGSKGTSDETTAKTPGTDIPGTEAPGTEAPGTDAPKETEAPPAGATGKFEADDAAIMIKGVVLRLGMDFLPYVETVGEAEIVEGQACLDGGYDTNYYYGGEELVIYTVAEDGKQLIYDIYITSAEYKTGKGAEVGKTTPDELVKMYGEPDEQRFTTYEYRVGENTVASFSFTEDDVLESIDIIDEGVAG